MIFKRIKLGNSKNEEYSVTEDLINNGIFITEEV